MTTRIPTKIPICFAAVLFCAAPTMAQSTRCDDGRCQLRDYRNVPDDDYADQGSFNRFRDADDRDYRDRDRSRDYRTNDYEYSDSPSDDRFNDRRYDTGRPRYRSEDLRSRLRDLLWTDDDRRYDDPIDSHFRQSSFGRDTGAYDRFDRSDRERSREADSLRDDFNFRCNSGRDYDINRRDDAVRDRETERNPFRLPREEERYRVPVRENEHGLDLEGYDPLTPPLPHREGEYEADALYDRITARYQNPILIRTVRSLSASQAVQLYREVSAQTDARHLEPSSYDLRVRRALRNLGLAMDNPAFLQGLGMSDSSFRNDSFRDYLARIWEQMNVNSRSDAEQVMQAVMQSARSVQGLPAGAVAYEFANATIDTLDKFSALEPTAPQQGAMLKESTSAALESELVGIGVEVKEHDEGLLLLRALRGGPAAEAGLKTGDIITAIDGRSIRGMTMAQSVDFIKGSAGTGIRLNVARDGQETRDFTLTRRRFRVWTVNDVRIVDRTEVGYVNLSQFAQTSTQELDDALQQLHKSGMKSLVLDLRGNPGGLLTTCVDISDRFLPCGTIVSTKGRLQSDNMHEAATYARTWSIPLVVLIDGDSASASEIFAAAIQENKRGVVIGEKSYGKGTVQTHFPLQSISGNLRLTTARFYSPSGRAMSGSGVTPDIEVRDEDGVAGGDRILDRALEIAQSRDLQEMAAASAKCRTRSAAPLQRNSFNQNIYDVVQPKTVLR